MQNPVVERIPGGGWLVLALFLRIIKNIVPKGKLRQEIKKLLFRVKLKVNNYIDIKDYIKKYDISPETYILDGRICYILNNFFVGADGYYTYIFDKYQNILLQSSVNASVTYLPLKPINLYKKIQKITELEEAINFNISATNYWHFTFTILDKILEFEDRGFTGKYILPYVSSNIELLLLAGVPKDKLIFQKSGDVFYVNKLHVIDHIMENFGIPAHFSNPKYMQRVKDRILSSIDMSDIDKYPSKLYIKRLGKRKPKNEQNVVDYLKTQGFKVLVPEEYSVEEQIKHFYAADIVVCPHGANSTNALFMRQNTHFVECFGVNYVISYILDIVKMNKISYHMIVEFSNILAVTEKDVLVDYNINMLLLDSVLYNLSCNADAKML